MKDIWKNIENPSIAMNKEITEEFFRQSKIVFDSNILLDLYLLNSSNRKKLFEILNVLKNDKKLYMPYQTLVEFHKNRKKLIDKLVNFEKKILEKIENEFNTLIKNLNGDNLWGDELNQFIKNRKDLLNELTKDISTFKNGLDLNKRIKKFEFEEISLENDPILEELFEIFNENVGEEYSFSDIINIVVEGSIKSKIPYPLPGSEDLKKKNENEFGDFFIWKELIQKKFENVIFVSNEKKKDWVDSNGNLLLSLQIEYSRETNNGNIKLINFNEFIDIATKVFNINETEDLKENYQIDENRNSRGMGSFISILGISDKDDELTEYKNKLLNLQISNGMKLGFITSDLKHLSRKLDLSSNPKEKESIEKKWNFLQTIHQRILGEEAEIQMQEKYSKIFRIEYKETVGEYIRVYSEFIEMRANTKEEALNRVRQYFNGNIIILDVKEIN